MRMTSATPRRDRPQLRIFGGANTRQNQSGISTPKRNMGDNQPVQLSRSVLILYGSETGNAQEVAEELGALTERLRFATHVSELNQYKPVCTSPEKQWFFS